MALSIERNNGFDGSQIRHFSLESGPIGLQGFSYDDAREMERRIEEAEAEDRLRRTEQARADIELLFESHLGGA